MRATLALFVLWAGSFPTWAQGTVNFANNQASAIINCLTGARLVTGNTFTAELWYAPDTGSFPSPYEMMPLAGARTGISPIPGLITGGTKTTPPLTAPGGTAYFQIRIWETAYASSWEQAVITPGGLVGTSSIIKVKTGNPNAIPPEVPGSLVASGLQSFVIGPLECPEPSTYALGALGLASLFALRPKRRR